jgi:hypothetical protein
MIDVVTHTADGYEMINVILKAFNSNSYALYTMQAANTANGGVFGYPDAGKLMRAYADASQFDIHYSSANCTGQGFLVDVSYSSSWMTTMLLKFTNLTLAYEMDYEIVANPPFTNQWVGTFASKGRPGACAVSSTNETRGIPVTIREATFPWTIQGGWYFAP